jgi:diacylglycerol kinase family enzyme
MHEMLVQIDGELVRTTPLKVKAAPEALNIII